jgi:bifunctional N-acetylglucosamine-1-phosphate-uridyltransferase/glucosamine-1-phosphate-acetyltransferase GlmU-like protein
VTRLLVIPAAGRGSRLGGTVPKPLVPVNGRPMLDHLADLYRPFADRIVVVAHPSFAADVRAWAAGRDAVSVTEQDHPTGMLDAICLAMPAVLSMRPDTVWITWADQIGVLPETVERLATAEVVHPDAGMIVPTVMTPEPYIHFERDADRRIVRLLQRREGDRMPAEGESDMGVFALRDTTFMDDLPSYAATVVGGSGTGERNFLPFVPWLAARKDVASIPCTDPRERIGVNTPEELSLVSEWIRARRPPA